MIEYLNCDACTAVVSTEMTLCEYCGNDFKNSGSSGEIIRLKNEIEKKIYKADISELLGSINKSKFKNHPVILFRKTKALLLEYMTNDGILDADEFCEVIKIVNDVSKVSEDYWTEFVSYLTVLLPTSHTKLSMDDLHSILAFLTSIKRDTDKIIYNRLIQQVLITVAGDTFLKEYNYYTDEKNYINNKDFISKKQYLINKYELLRKEIINNLEGK